VPSTCGGRVGSDQTRPQVVDRGMTDAGQGNLTALASHCYKGQVDTDPEGMTANQPNQTCIGYNIMQLQTETGPYTHEQGSKITGEPVHGVLEQGTMDGHVTCDPVDGVSDQAPSAGMATGSVHGVLEQGTVDGHVTCDPVDGVSNQALSAGMATGSMEEGPNLGNTLGIKNKRCKVPRGIKKLFCRNKPSVSETVKITSHDKLTMNHSKNVSLKYSWIAGSRSIKKKVLKVFSRKESLVTEIVGPLSEPVLTGFRNPGGHWTKLHKGVIEENFIDWTMNSPHLWWWEKRKGKIRKGNKHKETTLSYKCSDTNCGHCRILPVLEEDFDIDEVDTMSHEAFVRALRNIVDARAALVKQGISHPSIEQEVHEEDQQRGSTSLVSKIKACCTIKKKYSWLAEESRWVKKNLFCRNEPLVTEIVGPVSEPVLTDWKHSGCHWVVYVGVGWVTLEKLSCSSPDAYHGHRYYPSFAEVCQEDQCQWRGITLSVSVSLPSSHCIHY
jgi:hypothetical protein